MKVKFCGIRREEDVAYLNEFPPDYAGFVFAGTKRRVTPETARRLAARLDPRVKTVGVFVNEPPETVALAAKRIGLSAVQLHGEEDEAYLSALRGLLPGVTLWKAVRVRSAESVRRAALLSADLLLLDAYSPGAYGGTGKRADPVLIRESGIARPYFLAGGLCAENLAQALRGLSPCGVDLSGGIETNGAKDPKKMETILRILRETQNGKAGE